MIHQGRITVRKDVTVYGLTQIIEAIKNKNHCRS